MNGACRASGSTDLKSRGFENAGLYDPPGVGGTHVMYVLHHADKPAIYAGLPDDPQDQPDGRGLEGRHEADLAGRRSPSPARRLPASHRHGPEPGPDEDETKPSNCRRATSMSAATSSRATACTPANPSSSTATPTAARINHWITAVSLDPAGAVAAWRCSIRRCSSSPACSAAGRSTRAIHPWIGVVLFFSFLGLFFRFWRAQPAGTATTAPGCAHLATCSTATRRACPRSASTMPARSSSSGRCRS